MEKRPPVRCGKRLGLLIYRRCVTPFAFCSVAYMCPISTWTIQIHIRRISAARRRLLCGQLSPQTVTWRMARPKEFARDEVLDRAIETFSDRGFAGTSTDVVLQAMGISRQSLYDTFGDKRQLYLEALRRYGDHSLSQILRSLQSGTSPLARIETALIDFASRPRSVASLGCLGVSSVCEFGASDEEVIGASRDAAKILTAALEREIVEGQRSGEIAADIKVRAAAQLVIALFTGLKVAARGGASAASLRDMARVAIRSLKS
jgi:TetR/AcrR family transcriptional repressor of nem operon